VPFPQIAVRFLNGIVSDIGYALREFPYDGFVSTADRHVCPPQRGFAPGFQRDFFGQVTTSRGTPRESSGTATLVIEVVPSSGQSFAQHDLVFRGLQNKLHTQDAG
jgi:cation transport regulator ChaC